MLPFSQPLKLPMFHPGYLTALAFVQTGLLGGFVSVPVILAANPTIFKFPIPTTNSVSSDIRPGPDGSPRFARRVGNKTSKNISLMAFLISCKPVAV